MINNLLFSSCLRSSGSLLSESNTAKRQHCDYRKGCKKFFHEILFYFKQLNFDFLLHGDCFVIPTSCRWHLVQSFCVYPCLKVNFRHGSPQNLCGETGIRTPETLLKFTRFPGVPLKPLEHLSFRVQQTALSDVAMRHKARSCFRSPKNNVGTFFFGCYNDLYIVYPFGCYNELNIVYPFGCYNGLC